MAQFLVWTDLHVEFHKTLPPLPQDVGDLDAILIAGDLSTRGRHIDAMLEVWGSARIPVRMVYGNHEFYDQEVEALKLQDADRISHLRDLGADIDILDRKAEVIAGIRVLGCTLWTDLNLYPDLGARQGKIVAATLNDFQQIMVKDDTRFSKKRPITTDDFRAWHRTDREWLLSALKEGSQEPTLVMTHHMPCKQLLHPTRCEGNSITNAVNAGFASDLWRQIAQCDVVTWIYGHTHENWNWAPMDHPVTFISNARGYPQERRPAGARDFDPGLIVEVPGPPDLAPSP